jgi:hypothetical protein
MRILSFILRRRFINNQDNKILNHGDTKAWGHGEKKVLKKISLSASVFQKVAYGNNTGWPRITRMHTKKYIKYKLIACGNEYRVRV